MIQTNPRAWKGLLAGFFGTVLGVTTALAQNPTSVDIDLVAGSSANTLDVMVKPNGQGFSDVVSALTFTLSWSSSSSAVVGTATNYCPGGYFLSPSAQVTNANLNYLTYNAFGGVTIAAACPGEAWTANTWHKVLTIPVTGTTTCTSFNIVNDTYTAANNRNFYVSLGGANKTGTIEATGVSLGNCTTDCLGVVGGTALPGTACDDGNSSTTNDTWSVSCVCAGTIPCTAPTAGSISSNSPICQGSNLTLSVSPTGTAPFTYTWSGTGTFSPNNTSQSVTVSGAASGTYSVTVSNGCGNSTANTTVTVNSPANAGTNGTLTVCSNGSAVSLLAALGGSPQAGGSWSGPSTVTSNQYNPATMNPGVYTYTVSGTAPCPNASATVTVTENTAPNAGTNGTLTVCSNGATVSLFAQLGGSPSAGGTWSGPSTVTGGNYDPATMNPGVYTYTVAGTAPCANATATVTVTENTAPNAGTSATTSTCSNSTAFALLGRLGGSPNSGGSWTDPSNAPFSGTFVPGTSVPGTYTYTVSGTAPCANATATVTVSVSTAANAGNDASLSFCSNGSALSMFAALGASAQAGGNWSGPSAVISNVYDPATMNPGAYTYTVTGVAPCTNDQAVVNVTETTAPNAGADGTLTICSNASPVALAASITGEDAGGVWTGPGGSAHGANYDPSVDGPGIYTYTVTGASPCGNDQSTVTVTENAAPNAGTNGTLSICANGVATSLLAQLGGSPQAGGTWSGPSTVTNNQYDPVTMNPGTYTYTVAGTAPCANATATVVVSESATATWYADADGDGAGDPAVTQQSCTQPQGFVSNNNDLCPTDGTKTQPGQCGCGNPDTDSDGDGTANCVDGCPNDPNKIAPGACGCGVADVPTTYYADGDGDGLGDPNSPQAGFTCNVPAGFVANNTDACPTISGTVGSQCDDHNAATLNDVITANCVCAGTLPNDCLGVPGGPAQPGTSCDDGNACTINDVYDVNCACAGTLQDSDGDGICDAEDNCPNLAGQQGDQCDDQNAATLNDVITANCVCAGTLPNDCLGVPGGPAQPGTSCDDGNACTINDVYDANCACAGTVQDSDGDGICDAEDNCPNLAGQQGDVCDDHDAATVNDIINADCVCVGETLPNDCLGVPGGPALPGTACDDGDACTINDIYSPNCVCMGTVQDTDGDGTCDANDGCPGDPNKVAPGECGCGVPDTDSDSDGIADCHDSCPNALGQMGDACNDNDPNTINDMLDANCVCVGDPIVQCDNWSLTIATDNAGNETTWEIRDANTNAVMGSGGPYDNNSTITETICLPTNTCYTLSVFDSGNNGIGNGGGYVLRDQNGERAIDNSGNGSAFTAVSQSPEGFCSPLGTDELRFIDCDNVQRLPNDMIMAVSNPLVTAQWQVGNQTDDGYEFWFTNPNGGYSRRVFHSHATSGGYAPADAYRACKMGLGSITVNPLPQSTLLNVRVRGRVNGVNLAWGPACRMKIDPAAAACPLTQLRNDPSASFVSCGATGLERNGTSHITAVPLTRTVGSVHEVANRYRFRFENVADLSVFTIVNNSYPLTITPQMPFQYGATYNVQVQGSFDGGVTYCPYGPICQISFRSFGQGGRRDLDGDVEVDGARLDLWPNPTRDGIVHLMLTGLPDEEVGVDIDVYNATGQRVHSEHTAKAGTELNHAMDLRGDLPTGLYLVNVTVGERVFVRRLVVQ